MLVRDAAVPDATVLDAAMPGFDASVVATTIPSAPTPTVTTATTQVRFAAPSVYSEADLMALVPGDDDLQMRMAAEAFVHSYFSGEESLGELIGSPAASVGHVSYVEWARAYQIETDDTGGYSVSVGFQLVVGPIGGPFNRLPVRSVAIRLRSESEGVVPHGLPVLLVDRPFGDRAVLRDLVDVTDIPRDLVRSAVEAASSWGDAQAVTGRLEGDIWTVLVEVAGAAGGHWTVAVEIESSEG